MSSSKSLDMHFLRVECLGFFNPFIDGGRDDRHGKDHCGNSLINSQGELVNESDIISDSCFAGKVLEVSDILLESIVCDPIGAANGLLDEFRQIQVGSGFGVEGIKGGFKIFGEFVEGFVRGFDGGVGHLVILLRFFFLFFLPLMNSLFHLLHMGIMSYGCPCDPL